MLRAAWRVKAGTISKAEMDAADRRVRERGARRYIELQSNEFREWDEIGSVCRHVIERWRQSALQAYGCDIATVIDDALNAIEGVVCCDAEPAKCALVDTEPMPF